MNESIDESKTEKRTIQCDDNKRKCMMTPSSKSNKMNNVSPVNIMQPIFHSLPKEEYDLSNLLERERLGYVPQYIDETTEITPVIRGMLVDWIMSICSELGFYRDTFHTAINIMDRYLSKNPHIPKEELQGIGAASLSLAAKFIEVHIKGCTIFSECTASTCSPQEISENEKKIFYSLNYSLPISPVCSLLGYYLNVLLKAKEAETQETMSDVEKSIFYFKCIDIYDRLLIDHHINSFQLSHILICILYSFSIDYDISVSCFRFLPDIATLSTECQQWILNVAKTAPAHPGIALLYEQHDELQLSLVNKIQTHNQYSYDHFLQLLDE